MPVWGGAKSIDCSRLNVAFHEIRHLCHRFDSSTDLEEQTIHAPLRSQADPERLLPAVLGAGVDGHAQARQAGHASRSGEDVAGITIHRICRSALKRWRRAQSSRVYDEINAFSCDRLIRIDMGDAKHSGVIASKSVSHLECLEIRIVECTCSERSRASQ